MISFMIISFCKISAILSLKFSFQFVYISNERLFFSHHLTNLLISYFENNRSIQYARKIHRRRSQPVVQETFTTGILEIYIIDKSVLPFVSWAAAIPARALFTQLPYARAENGLGQVYPQARAQSLRPKSRSVLRALKQQISLVARGYVNVQQLRQPEQLV